MFEEYLEAISNIDAKYFKYAKDLTTHIQNGIDHELPLYATHGFCTDGGVAGAMIKFSVEEASIIPIDYWLLNHPKALPIFANLNWKGIVDLKPFNEKTIDFWVDHHISVLDEIVNAKQIRFDADGDSGAFQLLQSNFLGPYPEKIVELAIMTRTTDTANYITQPPIHQIKDLTDLDLTETSGEEGRRQAEQRIWLLDDAWGSVTSLKDHLNLHRWLAKDGFIGLRHILKRVNDRRKFRKKAYDVADGIEIDKDIIIFSYKEETQDKFTILRRLQKNGAKVAISFSKPSVGSIKISFRRNRHLTEDENERIQLQKLAKIMGGGGHAGASGAEIESVEEGFSAIKQWGDKIGLSSKFVDL